MALYKYSQFLMPNAHERFDQLLPPKIAAQWPGIYRCIVCGKEIAAGAGHILPPSNHHEHRAGVGRIQWQLVVLASDPP
jgi:hypothetical protein